MSKFTRIVLLSFLLPGIIITFFCDLPSDPTEDYSNADIVITSDSSSALTSLATSFSIKLALSNLIDSVVINYGDNTLPVKILIKNNDSLLVSKTNYSLSFKTSHTFLTDGEKTVVATAYMSNLTKSSNVKLNVIKPAQFLPDSIIHVTGTLILNAPLSLSVNAAGSSPFHYTWYKNATALPASDNAVYMIPSFQITDTGSYFCVVSNTKGVDTCMPFKLQMSMILFSVQYNGNGNTSGTVPLDTAKYTTGSTIIIRSNTGVLTKPGATFAGWNTLADGTGTNYSADANLLMGNANIVLFARWTSNPTFTITYNGNGNTGGTVPVDVNSYETGIIATIKSNSGALAKTGLHFSGWSITSDGTGASYSGGESFTIGASNVVLYAKWTSNPTFTITYNGNTNTSGTVPVDNTLYTNGQTASVLDNTGVLARTGYTFTGWNTNASGTGTDRTPGSTFPIGSTNVSLFAKWSINKYTVNYHSNGATSGTVSTAVTQNYQTTFTVAAQGTLVRANYQFAGWNTKANATGTTYLSGSTFTIAASNDTLFAVWSPIRYTITFDAQGATNPANKEIVYPAVTAGTLPTPVFTGCNFKGWWTTPFDTGTAGTQVVTTTPIGANIKVYARWTVTDVDGNEYKTVRIGNQTWMAENLKTTKYNDGTAIIKATTEGIWGHTVGVDTTNVAALGRYSFVNFSADTNKNNKYGPVYNWHAIDTTTVPKHVLAISGWHVPSDLEWDTLKNYLSANGYNYDNTTTINPDLTTNKIAKALCAKTEWSTSTVAGAPGNDPEKNNKSGFNALPGGYAWCDGSFSPTGSIGAWWSGSDPLSMKNFRFLSNQPNINATVLSYLPEPKTKYFKDYGFSVRLVKNN
jgi:uncharacterized protein (TIGR02145 family)/uncharacterized repeat protein (TIGR02543 family)